MDNPNLKRPHSISELRTAMRKLVTPESFERGLSIEVRPSDVFISPYAKCGTTWLQHVAHGLRSNGSTAFGEVSDVVPWLEIAFDLGVDPDAEQDWSPRLFKAHLNWQDVPKGGRYVVAFRDPKAVLVSMYQFFEGWFFEPGTITLDELGRQFFLDTNRYYQHILSWAPVINEPDVLALAYEDMVQSPDRLPGALAEFLQLDLNDEQMAKVIFQSSRDYMVTNATKFDGHDIREKRDLIMGLPPGGSSLKVQRANSNKPIFSSQLAAEFDEVWRQTIMPVLGAASYEEFHESLPNPLEVSR
ncbi:MAG: sulfotransferase domain-containing protein [Hyphomicrobiaceae bacterium]